MPTDILANLWADNPPARIRDMRYTADSVGITTELLNALVFIADHDPLPAMECLHTALARLGISVESQVTHVVNATNGRVDLTQTSATGYSSRARGRLLRIAREPDPRD